ncbi:MAG: DNA repair protein RecO [bacterium]
MSSENSALGLVLRRSDSGESDRRLLVLTEDFGKVELLAKGARKAKSRLAGSSEPLSLTRFQWASGRHRSFVTSVEPQTSFPGLRADYERLSMGLAVLELVESSLPLESPAPGCLELVITALHAMEKHPRPEAVFAWALSRLLDEEGQHPDWTACVVSGVGLDGDPAFVSASAGGYVSAVESGPYPDRTLVSATALIVLKKLGEIDTPPPALKEVTEVVRVLVRFWSGILEKRLPGCRSVVEMLEARGMQQ